MTTKTIITLILFGLGALFAFGYALKAIGDPTGTIFGMVITPLVLSLVSAGLFVAHFPPHTP